MKNRDFLLVGLLVIITACTSTIEYESTPTTTLKSESQTHSNTYADPDTDYDPNYDNRDYSNSGAAAYDDYYVPPPLINIHTPRVVSIPGRSVAVVENVPYDLFFCGGRWYSFWEDEWFVADSYRGPFVFVDFNFLPAEILVVPSSFFVVRPTFFGVAVIPPWHYWHAQARERRLERFGESGTFWRQHPERQHEFVQWREHHRKGAGPAQNQERQHERWNRQKENREYKEHNQQQRQEHRLEQREHRQELKQEHRQELRNEHRQQQEYRREERQQRAQPQRHERSQERRIRPEHRVQPQPQREHREHSARQPQHEHRVQREHRAQQRRENRARPEHRGHYAQHRGHEEVR